MTYSEWEKAYPRYVIIEKEYDEAKDQHFYNARGRSAYVLNKFLDYRYFRERRSGRAAAGGPNCQKIVETLRIKKLNFMVVANNQILMCETFAESVFPKGFVNPDQSATFLSELEKSEKAIRYTEERMPPFRKIHHIEGLHVKELIGQRVVHHSDGYGKGTIVKANLIYRPDGEDIYVEIAFNNGRAATPFSLNHCRKNNLIEIEHCGNSR